MGSNQHEYLHALLNRRNPAMRNIASFVVWLEAKDSRSPPNNSLFPLLPPWVAGTIFLTTAGVTLRIDGN